LRVADLEFTMKSTSPARPVVLIVDDYQDCRDMYGIYLSLVGFQVLKATNGQEALQLAQDALPDVILMDISLPGLDGYEVTRRLKDELATRPIPIIALTAQTPQRPDTMRRLGFETTIMKPCLPETLAIEVRRAIGGA
jgi:two-component system cell cycle response regulator DivK